VIEERLRFGILNIARVLDNDINEARPILDARLPDGSRVEAVIPPASLGGSTLAIRKFLPISLTTADLIERGSLPSVVLEHLLRAIENGESIIISGGTTTGKTTILNALAKHIPPGERIVVIEDTAEIQLDHLNVVRLEARRAVPGREAVTIQQLLEATLRLRPDRIIVGEVRGVAAYDLLQAMNTGHSGTLTTLHANRAELALNRLAAMALRADKNLDHSAIRAETADVVRYVLQIQRIDGKRFVSELLEVERYDYKADRFVTKPVYMQNDWRSSKIGVCKPSSGD
jgi:pilus assembly protein CpaF